MNYVCQIINTRLLYSTVFRIHIICDILRNIIAPFVNLKRHRCTQSLPVLPALQIGRSRSVGLPTARSTDYRGYVLHFQVAWFWLKRRR
jgi:hypothetical protein